MKKSKQYFIIGIVCAIFVAVAVLNFFIGVKPHNAHYIRLEVNPKVEFITDINNIVTSYMPLNNEAYELLIGEDFIGLEIGKASEKFIDLCTQANYIGVDRKDNAVRLTVVSGFMQALELKVYESINNYFMKNEIYAVIVENDNDRTEIKDAKDKNIASANKLALMKSICLLDDSFTLKSLTGKTETELLEILKNLHKNSGYDSSVYTAEQLANKSKLIDANRLNYEQHKNALTHKSNREFQKEYDEFKRQAVQKYEPDFDTKYDDWIGYKSKDITA